MTSRCIGCIIHSRVLGSIAGALTDHGSASSERRRSASLFHGGLVISPMRNELRKGRSKSGTMRRRKVCFKGCTTSKARFGTTTKTKRGAFARFYFLSNVSTSDGREGRHSEDELLEVVSQTKDPLRALPFLSKEFKKVNESFILLRLLRSMCLECNFVFDLSLC